jgi:hypothetical protein
MIIGLALAFLITLTILFSALSANKALKSRIAVLDADLTEADSDLDEAESDINDLSTANARLEDSVLTYGIYNDFLAASNASLRRRLDASDLAFTLLKGAGEDMLKSSDDYIDQLEGDIDDLETALGHSLALNSLQDAAIADAQAATQYESETADATIKFMLDTMVPVEELATLTNAVAAYDAVADKFIAKVENGPPNRSTETYEELKTARGWNSTGTCAGEPLDPEFAAALAAEAERV